MIFRKIFFRVHLVGSVCSVTGNLPHKRKEYEDADVCTRCNPLPIFSD